MAKKWIRELREKVIAGKSLNWLDLPKDTHAAFTRPNLDELVLFLGQSERAWFFLLICEAEEHSN